jgi:hypothetical protein
MKYNQKDCHNIYRFIRKIFSSAPKQVSRHNRLIIPRSLLPLIAGTVLAISILLGSVISVRAADEGLMSRLFSPGPMIQGHQKLEGTQCLKCHEAGAGVPTSKCLDCHKDIKVFVEKKVGFHGLATDSCIKCHSDHKGRLYDSTLINIKTFDHKLTGFSLAGKHSKIDCVKCHQQKRGPEKIRPNDMKYLGASVSCVSCHKKDDIHLFKAPLAKKDCDSCHGVESWKTELKFDHKRDGKYELVGRHAKLKCQDCHTPSMFKLQPTAKGFSIYKWPNLKEAQCVACHNDFHQKNLSAKFQNGKCVSCHTQTDWKIKNFDHKITGYALNGKHADLKCSECHVQKSSIFGVYQKSNAKVDRIPTLKFIGLNKDCLSCHKDTHLFGSHKSTMESMIGAKQGLNKCLACHDESSWKETHDFSHSAHTRYKIDGEHKSLKCGDCHIPQQAKYTSQHILPVSVAQSKNKFGIYHWQKLNEKTCENCHKNIHIGVFSKQQLQKKCSECHVTSGWKVVSTGKGFDHSKTRFPLTGKHTKATCTECHVKDKKQVFVWNSKDKGFCIECHDNVHKKQFSDKLSSQSCAECHTTESFSKQKPFDHSTTRYPLKGAHVKVECSTCHTPTSSIFPVKPPKFMSKFLFPNLEKDQCLACHKDVHKAQLGKNCTSCHSEEKWKPAKFDHQTQSKFLLKGKHQELKCSECHKPTSKEFVQEFKKNIPVITYKPISGQCVACHKDVHKGHFGQSCNSCHSEQAWKTTKDFHKNFSLSGVHFVLQCAECHQQGRKLSGLSQQCVFCHKKDDIHTGTLPNCSECHRQQFWENAKFNHSLSSFPLRGAHRVIQCQECHSNGIYRGLSPDCFSCHQKDAQAATSFSHSPIGSFTSCTDCHRNQFSFKNGN